VLLSAEVVLGIVHRLLNEHITLPENGIICFVYYYKGVHGTVFIIKKSLVKKSN